MTTDSSRGTHRTIVAVFPERDHARDAAEELADAGYHHTWVAATHSSPTNDAAGASSPTTTVVDDDMMSKVGRFFSGEADASLAEALRKHGVTDADATGLERSIVPGYAVLTVTLDDSGRQTSDPTSVIEACGGRLLTADYGGSTPYDFAEDRGSGATAAERTTDEERRIRLREERLSIDKQRVDAGEARVRKSVVAQEQSVDVPTYHEELYIERRPVTGATADSSGVITDGEIIRVPLSEERVVVEKRAVTTEEVVIGKRRVEDTQHVTETVRKEVLDVDESQKAADDRLRPGRTI